MVIFVFKDWQAGQTTGNKAALYISGRDVGAAAVQVLVASIRDHKPLPAKTIANTTIVTPDNWKAVMGTAGLARRNAARPAAAAPQNHSCQRFHYSPADWSWKALANDLPAFRR